MFPRVGQNMCVTYPSQLSRDVGLNTTWTCSTWQVSKSSLLKFIFKRISKQIPQLRSYLWQDAFFSKGRGVYTACFLVILKHFWEWLIGSVWLEISSGLKGHLPTRWTGNVDLSLFWRLLTLVIYSNWTQNLTWWPDLRRRPLSSRYLRWI